MGLSYRASRILERLHTAIQTRRQNGLDGFRARLHEQCLDGKREATERDFVAAVGADDGGVLSAEEARALFRELGGKDGSVPFAEVRCTRLHVLMTKNKKHNTKNAPPWRTPQTSECKRYI